MKTGLRNLRTAAVGLTVLSLSSVAFLACGGDDEPNEAGGEAEGEAAPTATEAAETQTISITAVDYGYEGVPETIEAGSVIEMTNASSEEVHTLVGFRLPEAEERPVDEIFAALSEEGEGIFGELDPALVLAAAPEGEAVNILETTP